MKKAIVLLSLWLMSAGIVAAFKVSPVKFELTIPRGQSRDIALILNGTKGMNIENLAVYATDLSISKTGVYDFKRIEDSKFSAVPWIKLNEAKIALMEGQKKNLKFKISVPLSALPGEYYSLIMIDPSDLKRIPAKDKPLAVYFKSRIYVALILNVPGRTYEKKARAAAAEMIPVSRRLVQEIQAEKAQNKYDAKHDFFHALPDFEQLGGKALIRATFQNTGNTHLYASGTAVVRSRDRRTSFGKIKLAAMGSAKEEAFTFPGDERYFVGVWDKTLPRGEYTVDVTFDYGAKVKMASASADFKIASGLQDDEARKELLRLEPPFLDLVVPAGALRTIVLKLSNTDFRPLSVSATAPGDWLRVEPNRFTLQPGESRNIRLIVTMAAYKQPLLKTKIVFVADRGKKAELVLTLSEKAKGPDLPEKRSDH
jgi:hypothetical protein